MTLFLSQTILNARLDVIETTIGADPILRIYTGTPPTAITDSPTGTLLVEMTLPSDWMDDAAAAIKDKTGSWVSLTALASGTAGYFRIYQSSTAHIQGTCGAIDSGEDLELSDVSVTTGDAVTITLFRLEDGTPEWGDNLLVNPNFDEPNGISAHDNFEGWTRVNDHWYTGWKIYDPSPNHTTIQLDHDDGQSWSWDVNDEDTLSQIVNPGSGHSEVMFGLTEIHHVENGSELVISLYGSTDGVSWGTAIWERDGLSTIPVATAQTDHYTNQYITDSTHPYYKIEFYGRYLNNFDGWKGTLLELRVR